MADGPLRLFVAVPLPDGPLDACRRLIEAARDGQEGRGVRWVRTENLHLTLRFLGATERGALPALTEAITQAVATAAPFRVRLAGAGSFPAERRPRALWIGITHGADELARLAAAVDLGLARAGVPPDARPFRAHLTVARADAGSHAQATTAAAALQTAAAGWGSSFDVGRVVLYRSHLSAGPPRYEELASFALPA